MSTPQVVVTHQRDDGAWQIVVSYGNVLFIFLSLSRVVASCHFEVRSSVLFLNCREVEWECFAFRSWKRKTSKLAEALFHFSL